MIFSKYIFVVQNNVIAKGKHRSIIVSYTFTFRLLLGDPTKTENKRTERRQTRQRRQKRQKRQTRQKRQKRQRRQKRQQRRHKRWQPTIGSSSSSSSSSIVGLTWPGQFLFSLKVVACSHFVFPGEVFLSIA